MANEEAALRLSDLQIDDDKDKDKERDKTVRPSAAVEQDAREEALRAELAGVQQINAVIEGVVSSLERAKNNMQVSFSLSVILASISLPMGAHA